jgi:hypothetical protein
MDVRVDREFKGDGVRCVFSKDGSSKRATRVFEDEQSAVNFAVYLAAQSGVIESHRLAVWLEHRGFKVDSFEPGDREAATRRLASAGPFTLTEGKQAKKREEGESEGEGEE